MHFGHNNPHYVYYIKNEPIVAKDTHSDLGLVVDDTLKFHKHADTVITKTMKKAHYILKSFTRIGTRSFSILYKTFLRPVLEYALQIGRPCYSTYLSRLEKCQRRLTKWCRPIRHLSYHERLSSLNLSEFQLRLTRGDLILTYKILNHLVDLNVSDFFCYSSSNTRGHDFRLVGNVSALNIRHRFFTERIISKWNSLPHEVVSAPTLNSFKSQLDKVL